MTLLLIISAAFEEKQMRLKALRNRQDLFQEEVEIIVIFSQFFVFAVLHRCRYYLSSRAAA